MCAQFVAMCMIQQRETLKAVSSRERDLKTCRMIGPAPCAEQKRTSFKRSKEVTMSEEVKIYTTPT